MGNAAARPPRAAGVMGRVLGGVVLIVGATRTRTTFLVLGPSMLAAGVAVIVRSRARRA